MPLPRLIAFDLDDTLAPSKSPLEPAMVATLSRLVASTPVCIISGGNYEQFRKQVVEPLAAAGATGLEDLHLMPTCGTQYFRLVDGEWQRVYAELLTQDEIDRAAEAVERRAKELGLWEAETWGPRIEDRETQVTFSALGQSAPVEAKSAWDPDGAKKSALRDAVAKDVPDLEVRSGGSTSVDITRRGIDKAYGMRKLEIATGIPLTEMLFIGDRLDVDGNDYPVVGTGVPTLAVTGWEHTVEVVEGLLADA
ncbi:HAD-IIB family hydrolase [Agrococcus sp. SL85]|uniref:HAD-IIB family hydrolase n=1 Tax=Agrococcus sp. SL85 TaxID=2995141 RepID=UPI00226D0599|nr:HAD-IIB family hydrolase [Agrococcus sp. SL85]WAC66511.1 HAD-IIB family hydrolase [Agrococcus sp. SL85]